MKEIDVETAADWDDQEFADNIVYLESRARYAEANRAKQVRAEGPQGDTKASKGKAAKEED